MKKIDQKIGILGGGQLGKMLLEAAVPLSLDISILDKDPSFPAGLHTHQFVKGDFNNYTDVVNFGKDKDLVTIEIEAVNLEALKYLEKQGVKVYPQPHILEIIKDKGIQKTFYKEHNLKTSNFTLYNDANDVREAIEEGKIIIPFVQKSRKDGYDGKGVHVVKHKSDLANLLDCPCLVEDLIDIQREIGIIVARNPSGEVNTFPAVEMEFHPTANLVEFLFAPSDITPAQEQEAITLATNLANKLEIVGLLAVEMFITKSGEILINEVAPRTHNSGHHTIEACITSQFAQQWRAILDLPLGDTSLRTPAVMINLLGEKDHTGTPVYDKIEEVLSIKGVYPHIYGKTTTKPYRKMGHITIIDEQLEVAIQTARKVQNTIKVISKH